MKVQIEIGQSKEALAWKDVQVDGVIASVVRHDGFPLPRGNAKGDEVVARCKTADKGC